MSRTRGFVYVATGERYVEEARLSAVSLRRFQPEPILLITNRPTGGRGFDEVVVNPALRPDVSSKLAMFDHPFDDFVFLDSDTHIIGPLGELFDVLGAFDLAVVPSLGGYHYDLPGMPHAFREPSTNMIAFRRSPQMAAFFAKWREYYVRYEGEMGREWDQRSFRHALYESRDIRPCFLGDEWSLSPYPGGLLCRDVRVLHGRPREWLLKTAESINQELGYRAYWGGYGTLPDPSRGTLPFYFRALGAASNALYRALGRALKRRFKR